MPAPLLLRHYVERGSQRSCCASEGSATPCSGVCAGQGCQHGERRQDTVGKVGERAKEKNRSCRRRRCVRRVVGQLDSCERRARCTAGVDTLFPLLLLTPATNKAPQVFELLGLGYTSFFIFKFLLFSSSRAECVF